MICNLKSTSLALFSFVLLASAAVIPDDDGELVLLNVIFRHGARTTYSFYPNDPHKNEKFYPYGLGSLTNEGKLGEYNLGKYLRNRYSPFLGDDYSEDKVYVRSTDTSRTMMSAQLVVAGLFPPSTPLKWNPDLMWLPVPILYTPSAREDIFHRRENCPYKNNVLKDLPNHPEAYGKFMKKHEDLYKYVSEFSGGAMKNPTDLAELFFILKSESGMNLPLPEWTKSVYPEKLNKAASQVYGFFNYNEEVRKINSGYHLKKIIEDSEAKANGTISPSDRKVFLYSGHESTVGLMLNNLGVHLGRIPEYGSTIIFELRRRNGEYFMKVKFYKNNGDPEPIDVVVPGCTALCPLEEFRSVFESVLPTKSVEEACQQNYVALHAS